MACSCVIDCRENDSSYDRFLTLNLGGKYVMQRVIDTVLGSNLFDRVYVLTNSAYVSHLCGMIYPENVSVADDINDVAYPKLVVSGRAPFIKAETLADILKNRDGRQNMRSSVKRSAAPDVSDLLDKKESEASDEGCTGVFVLLEGETPADCKKICLSDTESLVLNTRNDFELALVLLQKENKMGSVEKAILDRIEEKEEMFRSGAGEGTIGLIGHSQFDNWKEQDICGYKVLNYGIRGISSFAYYDHILKDEKLKLTSDIYLVMHGTNDIVSDRTDGEIFESIMRTFEYIRRQKPSAQIFFICCAHVNGRLDRSNLRIDEFNAYMLSRLPSDIAPVELDEMDDEFGNLESGYTVDGLHFSEKGYEKLKEIVAKNIKGR